MLQGLCLIFVVLIPLPMYFTHYIFSQHFFRGWVVITFLIAWLATLVILIMPLVQGRHTLRMFVHYVRGSRGDDLARKAPRETVSRTSTMESEVNEKRRGIVDVKNADTSSES